MTNPKRKFLSLEEIEEIFKKFSESNLSLAAFGRREKIPYHRLSYYKRRLQQNKFLKPKNPITKHLPQKDPSFLQILPQGAPIQTSSQNHFILNSASFQLQIPQQFQSDSLQKILEVLKSNV